jgi:rod shape-determining protein MreD
VILQSTVVTHLRLLEGGFNLTLIVVLAWNLVQRESSGPLWAFLGGVLADTFSGGPFGAATFALVACSLVIALTEGRFYQTNWVIAVAASVVGTILYHLLYLILLATANHPVAWADALTLTTLPSTILNLLLMLPVYQSAKWLKRQVAAPQVEIER